jgi:hypothetical protein
MNRHVNLYLYNFTTGAAPTELGLLHRLRLWRGPWVCRGPETPSQLSVGLLHRLRLWQGPWVYDRAWPQTDWARDELGPEILGHGFQDMVFRTWDLNFGAWIFTLAVSKTETWKLLGRDFQGVRSQFWDLDFTQGASHDLGPRFFLAHDFQDIEEDQTMVVWVLSM